MSPAAGKVIISGKENAEMRFPFPSFYVSIKNCGVTPSLSLPQLEKKRKEMIPETLRCKCPKGQSNVCPRSKIAAGD